jgi:hypothetical protein
MRPTVQLGFFGDKHVAFFGLFGTNMWLFLAFRDQHVAHRAAWLWGAGESPGTHMAAPAGCLARMTTAPESLI